MSAIYNAREELTKGHDSFTAMLVHRLEESVPDVLRVADDACGELLAHAGRGGASEQQVLARRRRSCRTHATLGPAPPDGARPNAKE